MAQKLKLKNWVLSLWENMCHFLKWKYPEIFPSKKSPILSQLKFIFCFPYTVVINVKDLVMHDVLPRQKHLMSVPKIKG